MKKKMSIGPYVPVIGAVIVGIIAVWTAFHQINKDQDDSDKREKEYKNIIKRSTDVLEDTKCILEDTKILLNKADETISKQSYIIEQQSRTLKELQGGDEIPKLIFSVGSPLGSSTDYTISFAIQNNNEFPVYDVEIKVIPTKAKRYPLEPTGRKTENEIKLEKFAKGSSYTKNGPFTILAHNTKVLYSAQLKFDFMVDRTFYEVYVKWSKGSYSFNANLEIQNFKPNLTFPQFVSSDKRIKSLNDLTYFEFVNGFNENVLREIERTKRETQAGEERRKEQERIDKQGKSNN
ncbi:hypothetical protein Dfri01_39190 [Dyadobacter frigoris]|nr:hypothetical protein Dfri01_39190 [Dyadobacter frigoris]